ncbi:unnamed protein product, partial [Musa hybrid cultivar]
VSVRQPQNHPIWCKDQLRTILCGLNRTILAINHALILRSCVINQIMMPVCFVLEVTVVRAYRT